jgi:[protein-PII] uridylyltransferase
MTSELSAEYLKGFAESLPASYRQKYDLKAISQHARISQARDAALVNVGLLKDAQGVPEGLCVVAKDQPGLLSTISGALVLLGMDIVHAEAYTRRLADGGFEAVDLFWLQKLRPKQGLPALLTEEDASGLTSTLSEILRGERRVPSMVPFAPEEPPSELSDTRVRFIEDKSGGLGVLEVETGDRSGLLLALTQALFRNKVQILHSEVTTRNGRVFDRFVIVEFDGSPINETRRLEIQVAVLGAVEPARRKQVAVSN